MWSPERVREVAATLLEADAVEAAVASTRPGWRLLEGVDDAHPVVRIGGPASLAEGEEWPRNERGVPLTFVCEIDTGRLPALPGEWSERVDLPAGAGVLRVFGDLREDPSHPAPALIAPLPPGETRRVAAAPAVAGEEDGEIELPAIACAAIPFLTLPEWRPGSEWDDDEPWRELSYLLRVEREIEWLRDPMRDGDSPDPWSLLARAR